MTVTSIYLFRATRQRISHAASAEAGMEPLRSQAGRISAYAPVCRNTTTSGSHLDLHIQRMLRQRDRRGNRAGRPGAGAYAYGTGQRSTVKSVNRKRRILRLVASHQLHVQSPLTAHFTEVFSSFFHRFFLPPPPPITPMSASSLMTSAPTSLALTAFSTSLCRSRKASRSCAMILSRSIFRASCFCIAAS